MIFQRTADGIKPMENQPCVSGYKGDRLIAAAKIGLLRASREADVRGEGKWLNTESDWRWFCKNIGEGYVRRFATCVREVYLQEHEHRSPDRFYYIPCESCGRMIHPRETYHWSYKGNGGTGINWVGLLCDECLREKHYEYVAAEWKTMGEANRQYAWDKSLAENPDNTPAWEAVKDAEDLPLDAEYVYELEYY